MHQHSKTPHFNAQLAKVSKRIPVCENIYILGDFNARVYTDQESWTNVLGDQDMGEINIQMITGFNWHTSSNGLRTTATPGICTKALNNQ